MTTTVQNIKDFFALAGFTVTNRHLELAQEALKSQRYGFEADGITPREPTPNDLIDWIFRHTRVFVNRQTEARAKQAVEIPSEDLLDE